MTIFHWFSGIIIKCAMCRIHKNNERFSDYIFSSLNKRLHGARKIRNCILKLASLRVKFELRCKLHWNYENQDFVVDFFHFRIFSNRNFSILNFCFSPFFKMDTQKWSNFRKNSNWHNFTNDTMQRHGA